MTLTQVRKIALALPEVEEAPHFDRTSFRVRNKIFVTAKPTEPYIQVFVGEEHREPALAMHPGCMEKLVWGGKVVGLRIALPTAPAAAVLCRKRMSGWVRSPKLHISVKRFARPPSDRQSFQLFRQLPARRRRAPRLLCTCATSTCRLGRWSGSGKAWSRSDSHRYHCDSWRGHHSCICRWLPSSLGVGTIANGHGLLLSLPSAMRALVRYCGKSVTTK